MKGLDYSAVEFLGRSLHTAATHQKAGGKDLELDVDTVVVGAGPGGIVTAMVLAEAGQKVVVVEAGDFWTRGSFKRDMNWAQEKLYQEKGRRIMQGNTFIPLASGRGVGGGTLVNSAICFRTPDYVLDEWRDDFGLDMWDEANRDVVYRHVEEMIGMQPTRPEVAGTNSEIARRGFEAMGVKNDYMPRNAGGCVGCGTCHTGCPTGGKASADLNWLPRYLNAGGTLYANTRVGHIDVAGGRARGVVATMRDPESNEDVAAVTVRADRVVMAAGAIHTPMMLQKQGLANSSGELGENLRAHPGLGVCARMPHEVKIWSGATQGYYAHYPDNPQILAETFSAPPDAMFTQAGGLGYEGAQFIRDIRYMAGCGVMIRDSSSGSLSPGSGGKASITYFVNSEDEQKFIDGTIFVAEMFFAAGAEGVQPLIADARFYTSLNHCKDVIRKLSVSDMSLYASHPLGTCRMHPDPARGVVRPGDARVHDVEGLHVTDASIFPTATGTNPQMTIMSHSLMLARGILGQSPTEGLG